MCTVAPIAGGPIDAKDQAMAQISEPGHTLDDESRGWLRALSVSGPEREAACDRLHTLLLRAARFEVVRRQGGVGVGGSRDPRCA
jgi:hypothetical protein